MGSFLTEIRKLTVDGKAKKTVIGEALKEKIRGAAREGLNMVYAKLDQYEKKAVELEGFTVQYDEDYGFQISWTDEEMSYLKF